MREYDSSFGGVFAEFVPQVWTHQYEVSLQFRDIAGGVPSDPNVAAGWIKSKVKDPAKEDRIRQAVEDLMDMRNMTEDEAVAELNSKRNCNGFLRNEDGTLCIEGRQIKAATKEAVSVAVAAGNLDKRKWGETNKGAISFAAEHIQVLDGLIPLYDEDWKPVKEPTRVIQTFPVNPRTRQTGIQYTEVVDGARLRFVVATDWEFSMEQWGKIWVTGNLQGIGASRSQDRGRYSVIGWEQL
jgi:hypothetical protein